MAIKDFPITLEQGFSLRLMTGSDVDRLLAMAQSLPDVDLQFMRRDITRPDVIADWVRDIEQDRTITILAQDETGAVVGYGSLHYNQTFWNRHMGEIRANVRSSHRGQGLGRRIVAELFLLAREKHLEKAYVYVPADHRPVLMMVERLGFKAEALLADWVKTRDDNTHDLVIMSVALNGE